MTSHFVFLAFAASLVAPLSEAKAATTRYLTGNAADVSPALYGPAHDLGGGGIDVDEAIQWMIDEARGCTDCRATVDVVVLRTTGTDGYNDAIYAMNGVDSIETLLITSASDANRADVEATVRNAEVVFFAGGDQCNYVRVFKGTRVETAVESVYARGGGVGGTSAGLAIQSAYIYDACGGSVTSNEALKNPFHSRISFTYGFFNWTHLGQTLADTHVVARDRMGRLMAFLARQIQDRVTASALGVAVEEGTSVVVDRTGLARVMGDGPAYFVLADHAPERCAPRKSLTYSNYKIWRLNPGQTFDLRSRPSAGYHLRSVTNGAITSNPY